MKKTVAIIEFNPFHHETIYSHLKVIDQLELKPILVLHKRHHWLGWHEQFPTLYVDTRKSYFSDLIEYFRTIQFIKKNNTENIIFNSAEGHVVRLFTYFVPGNIHKIGLIHNAHKLASKKQQTIVKKLNGLLVLSDLIRENLPLELHNTETLYATHFPTSLFETNSKKPDSLTICVPGKIDYKRKDYNYLINMANLFQNLGIRIKLLGNINSEDGKILLHKIKSEKVESSFVTYDLYLDDQQFFGEIMTSDLIMPLIHPSSKSFDHYKKFKISGAFNLAYALKKPLLMHSEFDIAEFKDFSVFYDMDNLEEVLTSLIQTPDKLFQIEKQLNDSLKFKLEHQAQAYSVLMGLNTYCL